MKGYKIVEIKNGIPYTLFHGIDGSRKLPVNEPITADVKRVNDNGKTDYTSGWHFFLDLEKAIEYAKRFKKVKDRFIIPCFFYNAWGKETNQDVFLAEEMFIPVGWDDHKISLAELKE